MKELITNLTKKMQVENFRTLYIVTINVEGKNKHILMKSFTSMGAVKAVEKDNKKALLVRVRLATEGI